jgi:hypothetical protein
MVEIIGELSILSKTKVWVERTFPTLYEYCYVHPGMNIQDHFNQINTDELIENWDGKLGSIEIETINRCNGECGFCPVSHGNDPREYHKMSMELFYSIIQQLKEMNYTGWISLQCNNEPLLDNRLFSMLEYIGEHLPAAKLKLFTNGTLLTVDKLERLLILLDHLFLDNYNMKSQFNPASLVALDYIKAHPEYSDKLTILVTRTDAKRGSRAGLVKNRIFQRLKSPCFFPFFQMVIRPDGKTSLCCNDAIGTMTLADLNQERIEDAWVNTNYQLTRGVMEHAGRQGIITCRNCDTCIDGCKTITQIRKILGGN